MSVRWHPQGPLKGGEGRGEQGGGGVVRRGEGEAEVKRWNIKEGGVMREREEVCCSG